ncbi:class I SAM-dependent methyltransferase [uncultured Hymenobacter sp.]|uniref:class I SAM-dependent methyltransferase n=1 Tax=uncultured Hymenobacter sp. TaxID=170016 RepID=UPI0035CBE413
MDAKLHYDNHLAAFYSWMVGDFDVVQGHMTAYFQAHQLRPRSNGLALDLGAGTGLQTIALARLGFRVLALDFNAHLLQELRERAPELPVTTCEDDLLNFRRYLAGEAPELVVCMGDTLPHLSSIEVVESLFHDCYQASAPGGRLVLSFRALTQELLDTQRFLPVRSDANRIHTCFLEYFPTVVRVTDLLHERAASGEWTQKVSSYHKLQLDVNEVVRLLTQAQWQVISQETHQGMTYLFAERH